jgi:hypothetical protein
VIAAKVDLYRTDLIGLDKGYELVTMFDCLHDMGDPIGAARHVRSTLRPDGTWMIVEPHADDRVENNFNPVGRAYYAFSTLLCTPASLSQEVGLALGADSECRVGVQESARCRRVIRSRSAAGSSWPNGRKASGVPASWYHQPRECVENSGQ